MLSAMYMEDDCEYSGIVYYYHANPGRKMRTVNTKQVIQVPFEQGVINAPGHYEEYLEALFGKDYMTPVNWGQHSFVEEAVEKIESRNPLWRDDFTQFYRSYMAKAEYSGQEHDETSRQLFEAQAEVIRKIAAQESCVIVGRCGFHIFRNHPNALKIFIHADVDCRKKRIGRKYDISESDAAAMIVDNDYSRELYTKTFTGSEWQDARNYDISLNVKQFGVNGAVDFLMNVIG
jgi:cytidylate kinase